MEWKVWWVGENTIDGRTRLGPNPAKMATMSLPNPTSLRDIFQIFVAPPLSIHTDHFR